MDCFASNIYMYINTGFILQSHPPFFLRRCLNKFAFLKSITYNASLAPPLFNKKKKKPLRTSPPSIRQNTYCVEGFTHPLSMSRRMLSNSGTQLERENRNDNSQREGEKYSEHLSRE